MLPEALKNLPSVPCGHISFLDRKIGFLSNIGHKTEAAIDKIDKTDNGVLLLLFLSWITCDAC